MPPILGYYIFFALGDGVLNAKFGHTRAELMLSECAVLLGDVHPDDPFLGVFVTIFLDDILRPSHTQAWLQIRLDRQGRRGKYELTWFKSAKVEDRTNQNIFYWGEAMVVNGQLVGAYWNVDIQPLAR